MSQLPEGRKPLLWKDMPFAERPKAHPSSWEGEAKISRITISRLEARVAVLENALRIISDTPHSDTCSKELTFMAHGCDCHVEEARAALAEKNPGS